MSSAPLIERGTFMRGRFEGWRLNRTPINYLRWLLDREELDFDDAQDLRREIDRRRGWHERSQS